MTVQFWFTLEHKTGIPCSRDGERRTVIKPTLDGVIEFPKLFLCDECTGAYEIVDFARERT